MTKQEIYQALADGKATSVQRLGSQGMYGEVWVAAELESHVIGWLASDIGNFDETRYRFKPAPVPPGDLTWEEAEAAFKRGEKVEWWSPYPKHEQSWKPWVSGDVFSDCKNLDYRIAPAPKMRTIKAEELPAVFYVRFNDDDDTTYACTKVKVRDQELWINTGWHRISDLKQIGATYSEHHSKGLRLKFEVEDK